MTPDLKRTLLTRKFSSVEYMQELELYFSRAVNALEVCLDDWHQHCQHVDTSKWNPADTVEAWEQRALPNYRMILNGIREGIYYFKNGDPDYIVDISNNVMNLTRNLDVLGNKWWFEIDQSLARKQGQAENRACKIASNIWRTVGKYWKTPESILKESITGPIDEQELLNYLKPGEAVDA